MLRAICAANYYFGASPGYRGAAVTGRSVTADCLPERGGDFRRQDETRSTSTLGYVLRTFFLVKEQSLVTARHGSINNDGVDAACYGHLIESPHGQRKTDLALPALHREESG